MFLPCKFRFSPDPVILDLKLQLAQLLRLVPDFQLQLKITKESTLAKILA